MVEEAIAQLVAYALDKGLIAPCERVWAINGLLEMLGREDWQEPPSLPQEPPRDSREEVALARILQELTEDAVRRGLMEDTSTHREMLEAKLMGVLTPGPAQVIQTFGALYAQSPKEATDWYYRFVQDIHYIRRERMTWGIKWETPTPYGTMEITINLSKPEKDPRAIAAAKDRPPSGYPLCLLCPQNEGYGGRLDYPPRANHRIIPLALGGEPWFLQYSPYVYYNEHCIVLRDRHTPMQIDRTTFERLLEFVRQFPHYFVGSNADLPIVGGSILTHAHFQGGCHPFAMERAPIEAPVCFPEYEEISAGILRWPMSVLRLTGPIPERLVALADEILTSWRAYTDPAASIFAYTDGQPHNTITPIARRQGEDYQLDLVFRNNQTTPEHPLGLYHPHARLHHIKKENIGLIEVMGLAVLPARLKEELTAVAEGLVEGRDLTANPLTAAHAAWAEGFAHRVAAEPLRVWEILQEEVGHLFVQVLEDAGVFGRDRFGQVAFLRFLHQV